MNKQAEALREFDSSYAKDGPINQRIVMNSRPIGKPIVDNFRIEELPPSVPNDGQILLKTLSSDCSKDEILANS